MKKAIHLYDSLGYFAFMIIANLAGTVATLLLISILGKTNDRDIVVKNYKLFAIIFAFIGIAITIAIIAFYFKRKLSKIFPIETETKRTDILKNCALLVLPGEILRFILSAVSMTPGNMFGYRFFDGFLAFAPNLVYDWFYLVPNNRLEDIRKFGYTFTDNSLFLVIYFIYFIVVVGVLFFVFSKMWKNIDKAHKNEIKIRMDPSQMK